MSIAHLVTRGFGNGTLTGDINLVVTRGYNLGEAANEGAGGKPKKKRYIYREQVEREPEKVEKPQPEIVLQPNKFDVPEIEVPGIDYSLLQRLELERQYQLREQETADEVLLLLLTL